MSSPQFIDPKSEDDPLLSPIFLSSGDDVTSTSSSSNSSSHDSGSPRNDWVLPSNINNINIVDSPAIWAGSGPLNHFNMNFPSDQREVMDLDMDFASLLPYTSPQFSIDPNALHFGGHVYGRSCETNGDGQETLENCDPTFQFSLSQSFEDQILSSPDISSDVPPAHQIPISMAPSVITSSSRSPSPSVSTQTDSRTTGINPSELTLISQLNQRVRDAAGVTLAVPMSASVLTSMAPAFQQSMDGQIQTPSSPVTANSSMAHLNALSPSKVAIPRLRLTHVGQPTLTLPVNTNVPVLQETHTEPIIHSLPSQPPQLTKAGRPKTSHTTIERRYRTNLNARILALRRAVPALRILERNIPDSGITQGKGLTGASAPKSEFNDIVNERGYVDGVKAAKKNSKGVVLGKAVEYIKVLKRREIRLRRETDGLKALLSGLVGGQELLTEWEKEWHAKFGGEEMDEVDEDAEDDMDGENDEGDDDDDEGDEEDSEGGRKGRPKKRGKVDSSSVPSAKVAEKKLPSGNVAAPQTGEKRKRGRPRKIQTPFTNVGVPKLLLHPPTVSPVTVQTQAGEPPKYLLAAFVLFNFFSNSPFSPSRTSTPSNTHEGTVLTHSSTGPIDTNASNWTWMSFQFVNTLVSVLLLVFLLSDGMKKRFRSPLQITESGITQNEKLHVSPRIGVVGLVKAAILRYTKIVNLSTNEHDLNSWRSIAEAMVLNPSSTSLISAVQAYLSFSPVITSQSRVLSDHITLALLSHAFSLSTAQKRWTNLQDMIDKQGTKSSAPERLTLSLELAEAIRILEEMRESSYPNDTPVKKIARYVILKATKNLAAKEWLNCVNSDEVDVPEPEYENNSSPSPSWISSPGSPQQALVLEAGKQLGGKIGELVTMLERSRIPRSHLWSETDSQIEVLEESDEQESGSSTISFEELSSELCGQESQTEEIEDTRSMLLATVLYKQIFSPNATPIEKTPVNPSNVLALRRTLASAAFDCSPETEDARDKVVDVLAEMGKALNYRREL
ncbi:hypothetical protein Clacol_001906 [Clathrus columnatus]|uniref:BHLH domain-containing protein n=1 Tax=Clathrus columnatus TaxID=1419009 RepID=A0AAV5A523_9AGAM|nr:hypothetical protein Clacol_001906 [Clathrus columnatus]